MENSEELQGPVECWIEKQEVVPPTNGVYIYEQWDDYLIIETPGSEGVEERRVMLSWDEVRALNLALAKRLDAHDKLMRKRQQMEPAKG